MSWRQGRKRVRKELCIKLVVYPQPTNSLFRNKTTLTFNVSIKRIKICQTFEIWEHIIFFYCLKKFRATIIFSLMNAQAYVNIERAIIREKLNEKFHKYGKFLKQLSGTFHQAKSIYFWGVNQQSTQLTYIFGGLEMDGLLQSVVTPKGKQILSNMFNKPRWFSIKF